MTGKRTQTSPVGSPSSGNVSDGSSKDQDRFLPIANVSRIMKKSLPANAKISKEAKETVQECVSEFISFITGEASDKCQREKRKTINGDDLLWAMTTLGFENYVDTLKTYLNKYREIEGDRTAMVTSPSIDEVSKVFTNPTTTTTTTTTTMRPVIHANVNEAYNSIGSQATPRSYDDRGTLVGYGENLMAGAFNIGKIHDFGNANATRALATHLHQGVEW